MSKESLQSFLARVEAQEDLADALAKEFQNIRTQMVAFRQERNLTTEAGGSKDNIKKNRYKDILPYDQTRVTLSLLEEDGQSDYINASFIQGLDNERCYIATQGPLSHTVVDFWRMIWEYHVKVIVMACREVELGKKKCERYWPMEQEPSSFGPFSVCKVDKKMPNTEVVLRTLQVTFQKEMREVTHFQYVAWPDRGIPDSYDCFLEMIRLVRQYQGEETVPMCVHCSAGCGRTGVICTVDYVQNLINKKRVRSNFSIFQVVMDIRQQRPSAVQTKEQYEFVYHAVVEMFKKELKCISSPCYENLTEDKVSVYDDVASLRAEQQKLPHPRRGNYLRSTSVPAEELTQSPADHAARPNKEKMNDTYAVVNKARPGAPHTTISPASFDTRSPSLPPPPATTVTQYDNMPPLKKSSDSGPAPVYSTVRPKPQVCVSPTAQASAAESQRLNGSRAPTTPNYSLARSPDLPDKPQENTYAAIVVHGSDAEELGGSRLSDVPSGWSERVDTNPSQTLSNATRCNNKLRNFLQTGFTMGPPKKAGGIVRSASVDSYEDVPEPANQPLTNGLGFNHRIGRPRGPRDPPTEWSRLER